jgi:CRISPR-associated endonuclease Cas3-HD
LPAAIAGYTFEKGLILGVAGRIESPAKAAPTRPGYPALSAEPWSKHTQGVAAESLRRIKLEGLDDSYSKLACLAAQLHDLGKLQRCWQEWAIARQSARGKAVHLALAHTDYDWATDKGERPPPHHASASALYGDCYLGSLAADERVAVLLAVLAHHGGTLKGTERADQPHSLAQAALDCAGLGQLRPAKFGALFDKLEDDITERFETIWPLASILSRILRLSDQAATAEGGNG